jgi:carbamoyl-phosphate synthase small subunit
MGTKGYLILENGTILEGYSFGSLQEVRGEVVFNTGMVGYPEGYTDPSYYGQILINTYPLIGNYGIPQNTISSGIPQNFESERPHIRGLIVSTYTDSKAHWQAKKTLGEWLSEYHIPALSGIDTRTLTKTIRETGVMKGIITFTKPRNISGFTFSDINTENLVKAVSIRRAVRYGKGKKTILLIDCGVKLNMIRILVHLGVQVLRVPWDYDPYLNKHISFDGLIISNGPGDPKTVTETIRTVASCLDRKVPTLGICLGNQILALAVGADTYKLKFGHRGQNQPARDEITGHSYITTQNHGFAVDPKTLPKGWVPWFTNLNDSTNEGIHHTKLPFSSVQFHPEATPGPTDTEWIFQKFIKEIV